MQDSADIDHVSHTVQLVSAYVANNSVDSADLPRLIERVHATLATLGEPVSQPEKPKPVVPISKSVTPDYIICLEDGKRLKMLKRHLKSVYNLTPEDYRNRWDLPADYPMVSPNYAKQRSMLAKEIGLGGGRRRRTRNE